MLLRTVDDDVERCTVALVAPDEVITASHCLDTPARAEGALCHGVWIAFATTASHPLEWAACDHVLHANVVDDAEVMRSDVARLRLARPVDRPTLPVLGEAPDEGSIVTVLSAREHPIYPRHNEIVPRLCRVATSESAVETFGEAASSVGWLIDCPSYPGNSGSPVLDAQGRLRSLMHAGSAPWQGIGVTSTL